MATKITHKEAEQLSRNYFEIPENPSKLIFFHERYLTHIQGWRRIGTTKRIMYNVK